MNIAVDGQRLSAELHTLATFSEPAAEGAVQPGDTAVTRGDLCGDLLFSVHKPVTEQTVPMQQVKDILSTLRFDPQAKPTFRDAFAYATVEWDKHQIKGAALAYRSALAFVDSSDDPCKWRRVTTDQLSMALGMSGDLNESRAVNQAAIVKDPTYPLYYYNLACADAEAGDAKAAQTHLQQAFDRRANTISSENFPDPAADDSFQKLKSNKEFIVFSERDREARDWLKQLALDAGLGIREDAVGNTFFRWTGSSPELPAIATGSHIDAIPNAGMYDGTVGVLGGLEAIRSLQASGFKPIRSIELILFTSEEPTRFGIGCLGSRVLSGTLSAQSAQALRDSGDLSLDQARAASGFTAPLASALLQAGYYAGFVELHIEQGPLLERGGIPIGIVTHIAAPASWRITIQGEGGHAGAMLMPIRRDALAAAAEIVLSVESAALATGVIDTVATVGMCAVFPGAVNSVPSRVRLSLDVRDTDLVRRDSVLVAIARACDQTAAKRNVIFTTEVLNADAPAACNSAIVEAIEQACIADGVRSQHMVSRAYHDSLFMARLCPVAMIFIPCRNGVSHRPDEYAKPEDIATGTRILARTLAALSTT